MRYPHQMLRLGFAAVAAGLLLFVLSKPSVRARDETGLYRRGEVIVKLKGDEKLRALGLSPYARDLTTIEPIEIGGEVYYRFVINEATSVRAMADLLRTNPEVEFAEPNYLMHAAAVNIPSDPRYQDQRAIFEKIKAPDAWGITTGSRNVVVAVLDSGVDIDHPDLAANIWINPREIPSNNLDDDGNGFIDDVHGWDFLTNSNNVSPKPNGVDDNLNGQTDEGVSHGSYVAGIIGAVGGNGEGGVGAAWQVTILPIRVLDSEGDGDTLRVAQGIDYAVRNGAAIINMSFGGAFAEVLTPTLTRAWEAGTLLVAATGNTALNLDSIPQSPVCNDADNNIIIGVSSVTLLDQPSSFTSFGALCSDIAAPSENFLGPLFHEPTLGYTDRYGSFIGGTSVSSALVSGMAALIKSFEPTWSNVALRDKIIQAGFDDVGLNLRYGKGRINFLKGLTALRLPYTLIKASLSDRVYLLEPSGTALLKRWISSADLFLARGYSFANVITVGDNELNSLADGPNVTYPDGLLVKGSTGDQVYFLQDGKRRWLMNATIFIRLGFTFSAIRTVDAVLLNQMPLG
ncbi:MAG: S8 family serine peptidase, partial [Parcubacteria group bacterium]|nr:S8 family serine peptidase [Parcubacteria group bacterium]